MDLKNLFETDGDERGVSPVIGVILMVAITVILAAVIGAFVIGIGDDQQDVPQASWDFSEDSSANTVTATHNGGDTFTDSNTGSLELDSSEETVDFTLSVSAGDEQTVDVDSDGDTVNVVWEAPGGGSSSVLQTYDYSG